MEIKGIKVEALSKLVKDVVIVFLVGVSVFKIIQMDTTLNLSDLSATDLVALLLAVFSVGLSAAFYFAATGSSERFYDNMHKFTKDASVILGELKEQVKSVDKGQQEVKARVEYYGNNGNSASVEDIQTKEQKVIEAQKDMNKIMSTIFENMKIDQTEKDKIKAELIAKEKLLADSISQLSELKSHRHEEKLRKVRNHTRMIIRRKVKQGMKFEDILSELIDKISGQYLYDMIELGFFEEEQITSKGIEFINQLYQDTSDN
ncbi:TPA: hypothetical protein ACNU2W_001098 [Aeromonas salmonicida subsp. pectinolytica]